MNTILLLDLENTIIWDWETNSRLMCSRFPILKEWVMSQLGNNTRVGLLSWAVWNPKDLKEFNENGIRNDIELTHHFKFDDELIFTLEDCIVMAREWFKMPFLTQSDFFDFVKKRHMAEELWLHKFDEPDTKVILFDDTVPNIVMHRTDVHNNSLELVDPWTIIKRDFI
jgi:hypothetical protein